MEKQILEFNEIAKEEGKKYPKHRFIYADIKKRLGKKIFIGIIGPRGAGKTVLLRQFSSLLDDSFYISLDTIALGKPLFDVAKELEKKGINYLLLDEVHFLPNFAREIKKVYDFLNIQIIFTGSISISLYDSAYDLSRRVRVFHLYPFSFDEFLYFTKSESLEQIGFSDLLDLGKSKQYYGKVIQFEHLFDEYLKGSLFPFTLESGLENSLFSNLLNKVLRKDFVGAGKIKTNELEEIWKVIRFIGLSSVGDISYSSISSNTGINRYRVEKYISLLEKSFILNVIWPKGTNVTKEPKILMELPFRLLYKTFDSCLGEVREDFFAEASKINGLKINYLKSIRGEKVPDYYLPEKDIIFEIGGKSKTTKQFKGFPSKRKLILTHPGKISKNHRPLFMYGMLGKD